MQPVAGKRITVAGLGRFGGGVAVARWLVSQGARVLVTDRDTPEKLADSLQQLAGEPIDYRLGEHRTEDFTAADLVVASPAIPPGSPYLLAAAAAKVPVTTEIRLFVERCPARIVGVTGTKGKSTTASMLGRMLATKYRTHLGGNIGVSLLDKLPIITADDVVVLELSSFMLYHLGQAQWSPPLAVVTMIGSDHLDWHVTREAYVAAKTNIVRYQRPGDVAVLCGQDPGAMALADICAQTGASVIAYRLDRQIELHVPGQHNQLNAAGATAAAGAMGVDAETAAHAVRDFEGLPHRLRQVHMDAGAAYFDDSIATVPASAVAALDSFPPRTRRWWNRPAPNWLNAARPSIAAATSRRQSRSPRRSPRMAMSCCFPPAARASTSSSITKNAGKNSRVWPYYEGLSRFKLRLVGKRAEQIPIRVSRELLHCRPDSSGQFRGRDGRRAEKFPYRRCAPIAHTRRAERLCLINMAKQDDRDPPTLKAIGSDNFRSTL